MYEEKEEKRCKELLDALLKRQKTKNSMITKNAYSQKQMK
jgi:hypothetical protein